MECKLVGPCSAPYLLVVFKVSVNSHFEYFHQADVTLGPNWESAAVSTAVTPSYSQVLTSRPPVAELPDSQNTSRLVLSALLSLLVTADSQVLTARPPVGELADSQNTSRLGSWWRAGTFRMSLGLADIPSVNRLHV